VGNNGSGSGSGSVGKKNGNHSPARYAGDRGSQASSDVSGVDSMLSSTTTGTTVIAELDGVGEGGDGVLVEEVEDVEGGVEVEQVTLTDAVVLEVVEKTEKATDVVVEKIASSSSTSNTTGKAPPAIANAVVNGDVHTDVKKVLPPSKRQTPKSAGQATTANDGASLVTDTTAAAPEGPYIRPGELFTYTSKQVEQIDASYVEAVERVFGYGDEHKPSKLILASKRECFAVGGCFFDSLYMSIYIYIYIYICFFRKRSLILAVFCLSGTSNQDRRRHLLIPLRYVVDIHELILSDLRVSTRNTALDFAPFARPPGSASAAVYSDVTGVCIKSDEDFKAVIKALEKHNRNLKKAEKSAQSAVKNVELFEAAKRDVKVNEEDCLFVALDVEVFGE
jgi:hypothetical protein